MSSNPEEMLRVKKAQASAPSVAYPDTGTLGLFDGKPIDHGLLVALQALSLRGAHSCSPSSGTQIAASREQEAALPGDPDTVADDVIELTSSEDDGAKNLPGDSTYRGRAPTNRVKASSGPRTRRQTQKASTAASRRSNGTDVAEKGGPPGPQRSMARPRPRPRKAVKSKTIITSEDEKMADEVVSISATAEQGVGSTLDKKRPRETVDDSGSGNETRPTKKVVPEGTVVDEISSSDLPELASIFGELVNRKKKSKESKKALFKKLKGLMNSTDRWRSMFLDLEAEEAEEDNEDLSGGEQTAPSNPRAQADEEDDMQAYEGPNLDAYDLNDPFIDDGPIDSYPKTNDANNLAPSAFNKTEDGSEDRAPDIDMVVDAGFELEDFGRQRKQEVMQQVEEDGLMAMAIARNQAFIEASLSPRSRPGQGNSSDDDSQGNSEIDVLRRQLEDAIRRAREQAIHQRKKEEMVLDRASKVAVDPQNPPKTPSRSVPCQTTPGPSPSRIPVSAGKAVQGPGNANRDIGRKGKSKDRRSFADVVASDREYNDQPAMRFTFPDEDETLDRALQDDLLVRFYGDLPLLRRGSLIPWNRSPGPGMVRFRAWAKHAPDMDADLAFMAICFVTSGHVLNASRACPSLVTIREISPGSVSQSKRLHAYVGDMPAIFTSCIFSEASCLRSLTNYGLPQNMLQGKFHTQEFERFVGFVCMVFGFRELHANLARDSMHFVTRPISRQEDSPKGGNSDMFSQTRSPSTKQVASSSRVVADNFVRESNNDVPIYDARKASDLNFTRDLPSLDKVLPAWRGEIPAGSFVMVGYTLAVYKSNVGNWTISCNIHWAIVIGIARVDAE
ncbi:hypothetical protein CC2G_000228 [Coprinopsis cinerea AmutBmut pab1-1]|nr:hypothetical protein CC2G_000228 [Coprinopsis cinerea AmutBmut pab1-1]